MTYCDHGSVGCILDSPLLLWQAWWCPCQPCTSMLRANTSHLQRHARTKYLCHLQRNIRPLASPVASSGSLTSIAVTSDECKSGMLPRYWYLPPPPPPQGLPASFADAMSSSGGATFSWGSGKRHKKASVLRVVHGGSEGSSCHGRCFAGAWRVCACFADQFSSSGFVLILVKKTAPQNRQRST